MFKSRKLFLSIFVLLLTCTLISCEKKADISEYGDTPITISGLSDEEFDITPNELAKLKNDSASASGKSAKAGTVSATGPLLETFLGQYGKSISDFSKIRFIADDGYRVVLSGEKETNFSAILAISNGSEALPLEHRPLRLVNPKTDSGTWVYAIVRIEFAE